MPQNTSLAPAFQDRFEAGRLLARMLDHLRERAPVLLALPRGGVPLGYEAAKALDAPLDLLLVRKLAVPGHAEASLGVVSEGRGAWIDEHAVEEYHVSLGELDELLLKETEEVERQAWAYRQGRPRLEVADRTVVVIDDGVATGHTARFALELVRRQHPRHVLFGAGVISPTAYRSLFLSTDGVYCPLLPATFRSIREWYREYDPITEVQVEKLLSDIQRRHVNGSLPLPATPRRTDLLAD